MSTIASQITSLTIVYSTVGSDTDQRKHQNSASLAFVWGIHQGPVNSPHKWPVTRKIIMTSSWCTNLMKIIMISPRQIPCLHVWRKYREIDTGRELILQRHLPCTFSWNSTPYSVYTKQIFLRQRWHTFITLRAYRFKKNKINFNSNVAAQSKTMCSIFAAGTRYTSDKQLRFSRITATYWLTLWTTLGTRWKRLHHLHCVTGILRLRSLDCERFRQLNTKAAANTNEATNERETLNAGARTVSCFICFARAIR